jgi:hypothetical protein
VTTTVNTVLKLSEFFVDKISKYLEQSQNYNNGNPDLGSNELTKLNNCRRIDLYLSPIHQELCMQLSLEDQWQRLLQSMAPNCSTSACLSVIEKILKDATMAVNGRACEKSHLRIPPQLETIFDQVVNNISTRGMGRGGSNF